MNLTVNCPLWDLSGYAFLSRAYLKSFIKDGFNPSLIPQPWVNPSFLEEGTQEYDFVRSLNKIKVLAPNEIDKYIEIGVGRDFIKGGKYSIGITTLEGFPWNSTWVQGCAKMDELWVLSEFDFLNAAFSGNIKKIKIILPKKEFLFLRKGNKTPRREPKNFLFLGQYLSYDRKGIKKLVKAFINIFRDIDVSLTLKLSGFGLSPIVFKELSEEIGFLCEGKSEFPKIKLIFGLLNEDELLELYQNSDFFISFSHGEGLGLPLLEAVNQNVPIIAPFFSGYRYYLEREFSPFLSYKIKDINVNIKGIYEKGQFWCDVRDEVLKEELLEIFNSYSKWKELAPKQRDFMLDKISKYEFRANHFIPNG